MTFDLPTALRNPGISLADLERMRDESATREPYVSLADRAIADAAQAEIDRRTAG